MPFTGVKLNPFMKLKLQLLLIALAIFAGTNHVAGQGTAFTYQGRLNVSGQPANGIYNLTFALFDSSSAGNQVGVTLTNSATAVTNGLFTVTLDYGGAFNGASRWLQIGVQTNTEPFAILSPLQPITPTPYAIYSANAGNAATATTATTAGTAGSANSVSAANITGTISVAQLPAAVVTNTGSFTAGTINISSNIYLPAATATAGIIYSGGSTLISSYGSLNFFGGVGAGNLTTSGSQNTGVGQQALASLTSGWWNTAVGAYTLGANGSGMSGNYNSAFGFWSLTHNTTGGHNTAVGHDSLLNNTTANYNTAFGDTALYEWRIRAF